MTEFQEISIEEMLEIENAEVKQPKKSISQLIKDRKGGITNSAFDLDVEMFEEQLQLCEWPNESEIYKEINNWNFATPTKECFDRTEIVKVYARLNAYRYRLSQMLGHVGRYYKVASTAQKSLKETAHSLYTGTASERNAQAGYRVRPFELESLYAEGILNFLTETTKALDSMFINLSANLKHIDNLVRVNHGYEDEGIALNYNDMQNPPDTTDDGISFHDKSSSGIRVRTRGGN